MATPIVQSPSALAPWWTRRSAKGLLAAVALSLLVHGLLFFSPSRLFSFQYKSAPGAQSLSTRMLESPASPKLEAAAPQAPSPAPAPRKPVVKRAESKALTPPTTEPRPPAPTPPEPTPVATAPEPEPSVAQDNTNTAAPIDSTAATTSADPSTSSGASAIKLQYPSNASMEFNAVRMSKGQSQSGSGQLQWKSDGAGYELGIEASAFGFVLLSQKSVGIMSPMGLAPERFSDKRALRPERATHFRRELGKIQFSNNKPDADLLAGAQDRLSVMVQIAGIIGGDVERYKIVNRLTMQVAGSDGAETWEFSIDGLQDISLPAANMQTLKLTRKPRDEFDQRLEIWLAPQLGYLPVRIRQSSITEPQAEFFDLSLQRLP